jgi:hypothetical protein
MRIEPDASRASRAAADQVSARRDSPFTSLMSQARGVPAPSLPSVAASSGAAASFSARRVSSLATIAASARRPAAWAVRSRSRSTNTAASLGTSAPRRERASSPSARASFCSSSAESRGSTSHESIAPTRIASRPRSAPSASSARANAAIVAVFPPATNVVRDRSTSAPLCRRASESAAAGSSASSGGALVGRAGTAQISGTGDARRAVTSASAGAATAASRSSSEAPSSTFAAGATRTRRAPTAIDLSEVSPARRPRANSLAERPRGEQTPTAVTTTRGPRVIRRPLRSHG